MQKPFKILFYQNGDPIDHRCIRRFINAFPRHYRKVIRTIIEKSERLNEKVFRFNVATLMPSFKMTRRGAFHGVKIDKKGIISDPNDVIDLCWKQVGNELRKLKEYINENTRGLRNRVLGDLPQTSRNYIVEKNSELFEELREVAVKTSKVGRVGASKVLFAILPEIALPVDNLEWKRVFKTKEYREILSTMVNEIIGWEKKTGMRLEMLDPEATLPAIYNIMAMAARPKARAPSTDGFEGF